MHTYMRPSKIRVFRTLKRLIYALSVNGWRLRVYVLGETSTSLLIKCRRHPATCSATLYRKWKCSWFWNYLAVKYCVCSSKLLAKIQIICVIVTYAYRIGLCISWENIGSFYVKQTRTLYPSCFQNVSQRRWPRKTQKKKNGNKMFTKGCCN